MSETKTSNPFNNRTEVLKTAVDEARDRGIVFLPNFFTNKEVAALQSELVAVKGTDKDQAQLPKSFDFHFDPNKEKTFFNLTSVLNKAASAGNPWYRINAIANRRYDASHPRLHPHIDSADFRDVQFGMGFGKATGRFWDTDGNPLRLNLNSRDLYIMRGANPDFSTENIKSYVSVEALNDDERLTEEARLKKLGLVPVQNVLEVADERTWHAVGVEPGNQRHSVVLRHT